MRTSVLPFLLFCLVLTAWLPRAAAQTPLADSGLVVYALGRDTTTVQYFQFSNRRFNTTILDLDGTVHKYVGTGLLDESGDITQVLSASYQLDSAGNWQLASKGNNVLNGDSTVYTATSRGNTVMRRAVAGKAIVSNAADPCSFYMFPYMGFFAPKRLHDTLLHCHFAFGQCRTYFVTRFARNQLHVGSGPMGTIKVYPGHNGRMDSANAIGSSLNFIATVARGASGYQDYIDQLAKVKLATRSSAKPTLRDTATLAVGNANIEIYYWAPMTRGRQIFGAVVPWNRVWRTGANNATKLRLPLPLQYNGQVLPAGEYSLWTYPTPAGWQLFINKKADVWGTEYDSTADVMKLPLHVEMTTEMVEALKITLAKQAPAVIRLQIAWGYYKAWADFGL